VCTTCRMANMYFSYVDLPRLRPLKYWLVKARGQPSWVRIVPIPICEAFDSTTKILLNLGTTDKIVVNMALYNSMKDCSTSVFQ